MIVVKLMGGLGNQLFQFAAAKNLAIKNKVQLAVDVSEYSDKQVKENYTQRSFDLALFNIDAVVLKPGAFDFFFDVPKNELDKLWNKLKKRWSGYTFYWDYNLVFQPHFFDNKDNTYLDGYFQSEKYFKEIRTLLLKEFTSNISVDRYLIDQIQRGESVAIHFRRGDYEKSSQTTRNHGTCSIDYYKKAIEKAGLLINKPEFFIFSDNIPWVKEQLSDLPFTFYFVEHKGERAHIYDFEVMRRCKHQIIANSTFSWWAAWLNENKDKMVIAPEKWMNDTAVDTKDITPDSWIKL